MEKKLSHYILSSEADRDIEDLFDYSVMKFGLERTIEYVSTFDDLFNKLLINPDLGRERNEIRQGIRSIPKESHIVFYRVMKNNIRVIRILHKSRDLPRYFSIRDV